MPHVSTHYRVYLGAAHHRRPRNPQPWVEPFASSEVDVLPGGSITPFAPDSLPYTPSGGSTVDAGFLFWSVFDGSAGYTQPQRNLSLTAQDNPLTLIAWYYLPGGGPGTWTEVLIDAYSVELGDFVDDDFVNVTSDPSLTVAANVDGDVPTKVDETVQAYGPIHTAESFGSWITSPGGASAVGDVLTAPKESEGLAVATYQPVQRKLPPVNERQGWVILFGIVNDSSGIQRPIGGGPWGPVGPWGPLVARLLTAVGMQATSTGLSEPAANEARKAMNVQIAAAASDIAAVAKKGGPTQGSL